MSQLRKHFGTDGIRGPVGGSQINPEFVLKLGWAVGRVFANGARRSVLIGKDTRVSGYMLESLLEAGLAAAGVDIKLLGPMPTPAVAYLTRTFRASAGIVISASHNLYHDNGIKFFSSNGKKLPDDVELAIEAMLDQPLKTVASQDLGKARRITDAAGRYIEFCKSTIPSAARFNGLKIVVDCANGATYHIAPNVLSELGANVIAVECDPDGFNINHNCGSTNPKTLQQQVKLHGADIGIAFDGDGDRLLMVDEKGCVLNGDQILYIIARERNLTQLNCHGVVGTVMSNLGLEHAITDLGMQFERAKVGDRYVMESLLKHQWQVGGESSGHIICLDKNTTGDGIVSALQVLFAMHRQQSSLHDLVKDLALYPQHLINIPIANAAQACTTKELQDAIQHVEHALGQTGRVLVRPSGTEPLLRVMVECDDEHAAPRYANELAEVVKSLAD